MSQTESTKMRTTYETGGRFFMTLAIRSCTATPEELKLGRVRLELATHRKR
jgi:hypothetical protein